MGKEGKAPLSDIEELSYYLCLAKDFGKFSKNDK